LYKFSFQDAKNAKITIGADRKVRDPEDPDYKDKMLKNKARAGSAAGKPSS
jgi:hypothetical protein